MDFFGIGFAQIFIVLLVALLFLGPEELPRLANKLGTMVAQARKTVSDARDSVLQEVALADEAKKQTAPEQHGHHTPVEHQTH